MPGGIKDGSHVVTHNNYTIDMITEGKGLRLESTFHHMLPKMEVSHALHPHIHVRLKL